MPRKRLVPPIETVQVSLGLQLLDFAEAKGMSIQTWAGAEEILETVDFSRHPASATALRTLLQRGWESDSVTGLLLGIWMRKTATSAEIAADLLALDRPCQRVLTGLYAQGNAQNVVQYSVGPDGSLTAHTYSRKSMAGSDIKLFLSAA